MRLTYKCVVQQCCDREEASDDCVSQEKGESHFPLIGIQHQCEATWNILPPEPENVNNQM